MAGMPVRRMSALSQVFARMAGTAGTARPAQTLTTRWPCRAMLAAPSRARNSRPGCIGQAAKLSAAAASERARPRWPSTPTPNSASSTASRRPVTSGTRSLRPRWSAAAQAEAAARQRHAARCARRDDPVTTDWQNAAYADYLAAERELCGNLAVRDTPFTDAFVLWTGTEAFAQKYCTEELRNWWLDHPRVTVTAYRNQVRTQKQEYRHDAMDSDDAGSVRPGRGAASAAVNVPGARPVRDRGSRGPARRPGWSTTMTRAGTPVRQLMRTRADEIRGQPRPRARWQSATPVPSRGPTGAGRRRPRVLGYARAMLAEYATFPSEAALDAMTLWTAHTHSARP